MTMHFGRCWNLCDSNNLSPHMGPNLMLLSRTMDPITPLVNASSSASLLQSRATQRFFFWLRPHPSTLVQTYSFSRQCNRALVMEQGVLVEFASPSGLSLPKGNHP